jgi:protoporphyrinogen oxidase
MTPLRNRPAPVVVLGAGLAGLTVARALKRAGRPVVILEAGPQIAGLAQSFQDEDGFSYDFGAHFVTNRFAAALGLGARVHDVTRYGESARMEGRTWRYPLGFARDPRFLASAALARGRALFEREAPRSAAERFRRTFGRALADRVLLPILEAWSGHAATALSPAVEDKLPGSLQTALLRLVGRVSRRAVAIGYCRSLPHSPHVWHVYPEGGAATLVRRLAEGLEDDIRLETPGHRILVDGGRAVAVRTAAGTEIPAAAVVSTASVNALARAVEGSDALRHLERFRYRPMIFVNVRLRGRGLLPDVVLWTPEYPFPFFRVTEAPQAVPWLAPEGRTILTCDIGATAGGALWTMDDDALGRLCVERLTPIVPDAAARYLGCRVLRTPVAYPVFLTEYDAERRALAHSTGVDGLYSVGRNGEFAHILMEDVYVRARWRARDVLAYVEGAATRRERPSPTLVAADDPAEPAAVGAC